MSTMAIKGMLGALTVLTAGTLAAQTRHHGGRRIQSNRLDQYDDGKKVRCRPLQDLCSQSNGKDGRNGKIHVLFRFQSIR